jgi:hypothetical protein
VRFIWSRAPGGKRRKLHLCGYDLWTGAPTMAALCGVTLSFDTSCNLPLGRPVCRRCAAKADAGKVAP